MSWLYYLLEANLYFILFFAFYYLVLRRETWYQYNRAYLLVTSALAFVIPFVQLGMLKPTSVVPGGQLKITQIYYDTVSTTSPVATNTSWAKEDYYLAVYLLTVSCLLINLGIKIYRLIRLSQLNSHKTTDKWKIIEIDKNKGAFSFFSYLFVSPEMALSETVIAHELVHIRQKHSWDIIYFELIKVVSWFNPIAYLLQYSIKELHEFIADSEIAGEGNNINQYTDFLLGNAYDVHESQLTNDLFNKSLLKKRIMMLHQKRSGNSARLKYLLVLPLSAGLLCASTLAFAKSYGWIDIAPKQASSEKILTPDAIKIKRLKVTQGSISAITDKISVRESKNKTGIYTVATLTEADKARLLKNYNIKVEVVETESPAKLQEMEFPIMIHADGNRVPGTLSAQIATNNDVSNKKIGAIGYVVDPKVYSFKSLTGLSLKLYKLGYKMNFDEYNENNSPMLKISLKKLNSSPELFATATFRVDELKKIDYVIFVGFDTNNNVLYVHSDKRDLSGQNRMDTLNSNTHKRAVSTTSPGKNDTIKSTKEITTQVNSNIKQEVKKEIDKARENAAQQTSHKMPPPPPAPPAVKPAFSPLFAYLGKNIHYPASEYEQKIVGNVVIELTIDNNKITGTKVINDARPTLANEALRALKRFTDTVNTASGTYVLGIRFGLMNEKMTKTYFPADLLPSIQNNSNFAGIVEIDAYLKD